MFNSSDEVSDFVQHLAKKLNDQVFLPVYQALQRNPELRKHLNPAFPYPREMRIGILDTCLAIEYIGPEIVEDDNITLQGIYQPKINLFQFLDIDLQHLKSPSVPCTVHIQDTAFFLGDALDYLCEYFYDFTQIPTTFMLNGFIDLTQVEKPMFISNTTFFWTDEEGALKIKHIDFLEVFPFESDSVVYHADDSLRDFAKLIIENEVPTYRLELHRMLNEFIEFINLPGVTEPKITEFLSKNPEILQIAFGVHKLNPQVHMEWQYDAGKPNLIPDFLPQRMDGYSDILEFKLPYVKSKPMVGPIERHHPSFEIDSAISQIDMYEEWVSQEVNTRWLEEKKNIKVMHPKKYLIIGHSKEFSAEERRKLRKIRNTIVFTYDEFIEMARYQIYRVR